MSSAFEGRFNRKIKRLMKLSQLWYIFALERFDFATTIMHTVCDDRAQRLGSSRPSQCAWSMETTWLVCKWHFYPAGVHNNRLNVELLMHTPWRVYVRPYTVHVNVGSWEVYRVHMYACHINFLVGVLFCQRQNHNQFYLDELIFHIYI